MTGTGLWLTDDIRGILRGLVHIAVSMPAGLYQAGYVSALEAVALALGAVEPRDEPQRLIELPAGKGEYVNV